MAKIDVQSALGMTGFLLSARSGEPRLTHLAS
jgi:hypothetical protein